jgi:hypothetical protein
MNTATEQVATRDRLSKALRAVRECCHPPLGEASWPSDAQLNELDSAVVGLAMMDRKRRITVLTPFWKAYEWVEKKRPEIRLLPRVKELVERADKLLKGAGESDLERLRRKASAGAPEARRLVEALEAIQEDASKAGKIQWEDYEGLLGDNKPFRLPYGDSARRDVRCYVRALQLIVDDLRYRRLRDQTLPLMVWIAGIGSPYAEILKNNYQAQYCADYMVRRRAEETKARQQEQWRERQRRRRRKKLEAFLRAEGISEGEAQKFLAANA